MHLILHKLFVFFSDLPDLPVSRRAILFKSPPRTSLSNSPRVLTYFDVMLFGGYLLKEEARPGRSWDLARTGRVLTRVGETQRPGQG